ncbi:DUF2515 domain-containing protein [Brevibacillus humidisoli]|uniref:DUF2515 family protein n=1 Tax=Brevibacillus humidisoli TaxID=2895522 RepID=UPI001E5BD858|nr:DUF2515 family protein [Brevibacillus humidisoli]UFJ42277.1 DUF2515 domain-containing protein [Brevibacillus humidisoli]
MRRGTVIHGVDLVAEIRHQTAVHNRNNLTRTEAYLRFYLQYPEVNWALLAHLVSRNGGWNMTDLRGEWLPRLMSEEDIQSFFAFLERCNWLIFHDAYPQLLLYATMKRESEDLTSLLPDLGVSRFMVPIWRDFLQSGNGARLSRALIINEQQYIEQRVVKHPFYRDQVLESFPFLAQSILSLNQILFPYRDQSAAKRPRLTGVSVKNFPSVERRINVGKTLYKLLFDDPRRHQAIIDWATRVTHTGSRADYWPEIFSPIPTSRLEVPYQERLKGAELLPGRPKLYSPPLPRVWPDTVQPAADGTDWYRDEKWLRFLEEDDLIPTIDENDYASGLNMVEAGLQMVALIS